MKYLILLLFIIHCLLFTAFAQDQHLVDSLTAKLKTLESEKKELRHNIAGKYDTASAKILYSISKAYWSNNPDKSMDYAMQCLALSEQINYKKGIGNAYNSLGIGKNYMGDYLSAIEFHKKALKIRLEIGDKNDIAGTYNNMGEVYRVHGNYPEALKLYFEALKINEESGNISLQAKNHNNIGIIYTNLGNYSEALKNHLSALKLGLKLGDKRGIANSYGNIGRAYKNESKFEEALKNLFTCLKMMEEIKDLNGIGNCYNTIGNIYYSQGNYPDALNNYFASLKIYEEIGDKNNISLGLTNVGELYTNQKKYNEAFEYLNKGLSLAKEIGSLERIKSSYDLLATLDNKQGNFNKALEHYKLYIIYRDSLVNTENTKKTLAIQMTYDFNKKQTADSIKSAEEKKVITAELKQEQTKSYALYGGLALMVLVASVFFRQRNKIGKEKKRSDDLLLNILPAEVAEELKATGGAEAKHFDNVSVLFTDFVGFTSISEKLSPKELVREIHQCFTAFDEIIERNGLEKIKTIGDAYLAVCGMPNEDKDHAKKTVKAAIEIMDFINKRIVEGGKFNIRIGINSGPVVAGIVGVKKFAYDIWGDTVNTAARMEQHSVNGKINISGSTYELVKNDFKCEHRGKIEAKNKGEVDMYFVSE